VESNHHSFRNTDLNRARLPIPPRAPIGGRAEISRPRDHVNRAGPFAGIACLLVPRAAVFRSEQLGGVGGERGARGRAHIHHVPPLIDPDANTGAH
jgi:hypothetical protein